MINLLEYEFGLGRGLTTVKCTIVSLICIIYCLPFRQVLVVKQIFNAGKASSLMVSRLFTSALHIPILLLQRKQARRPIPRPVKNSKYMFVGAEGILIAVVLKKNLMQYVPDSFSIKSKRNVIILGGRRSQEIVFIFSNCLGMKKHTVVASK